MYNFIRNQWIMGKYTPEQVQNAVTKGYITQEQADTILATPQVV
ncbi:XkdX family protein [Peribacillus saganii]|uniref:XkdX family protein n=1 Tax=Peribacillus saganii TaxID=2303992 RepID=A0A372LQ49_9BACI|nr:XkdX family protein [Peribacillus saganii]RFU70343.1 XkdX family protein [Peribacillus saganii]